MADLNSIEGYSPDWKEPPESAKSRRMSKNKTSAKPARKPAVVLKFPRFTAPIHKADVEWSEEIGQWVGVSAEAP